MEKVLVIDDDDMVRNAIRDVINLSGFKVLDAAGGREAIEIFKRETPDAVILDLKMPGMDGIETMKELKKIDADVPVIMLSGHGDIPIAVESIKLGAYDFISKPPEIERLVLTLRRAIERAALRREVNRLNRTVDLSLEGILGKSEVIRDIIKKVYQVAYSNFSIILQGETGTGKTIVARTIHNLSKRTDKPFIVVDMGVIPETLVESELFGHEKGAFTGAEKSRKGFFEIANGGTIFIDEIQNMPFNIQGKLLRAVEDKKICPLGSTKSIDVDVRIIAATNADIKQAVNEKKFREDLYFRLNEFTITLPPLRDRIEDIPFLASRFLYDASRELNKNIREVTDDALNLLKQHSWPGNVREFKNVIRTAVLLCDEDAVKPNHVEPLIRNKCMDKNDLPLVPLKETLKDIEKKAIKQALKITKANKSKAASILRIDYKTLLAKIKDYGL